MLMQEED